MLWEGSDIMLRLITLAFAAFDPVMSSLILMTGYFGSAAVVVTVLVHTEPLPESVNVLTERVECAPAKKSACADVLKV